MSEPTTDVKKLHRELAKVWAPPKGWRSLAAVNHSIVGRRFIITAFAFFLFGGVLAMLIRAQLATPDNDFLSPEMYNQVFTMHGTVMMFLFAIPIIEGFAIYMLPKMLGARDLAFPRLSAFAYWCYLFGGLTLIAALLMGQAPRSGWFMYTPLSSSTYDPGINADVWLIGVTFVEVSAVCAAVEFMATILKVRTAGMALQRMPLIAWYLWVTSAMMVAAFPPLILGSVLLEIERAFGWPFFDATRGGDPLLWQHLFWIFGHPEVYIIFLPAAGVISTVLPVMVGRPIVGYTWIVCAIVALGFISFGLWVHHMFTVGIPDMALGFFSAASLLVVVPTAIQFFSWLATMLKGRPSLDVPMLFIYGFFFTFVVGGMTGVMVAVVPFDWQVHDTHFVVAHFHYVLIGGQVFPALAGAYYWLPHFTGREINRTLGKSVFWMIFIGVNVTFLPMHLTGLLGMVRRIYSYPAEMDWEWLNLTSSIGGFISAIGFALFVVDAVLQFRGRPRPSRNPWKSGTLEWAMETPPPPYNVASLPRVDSREPAGANPRLAEDLDEGRGLLSFPRNGWRETLAVHMLNGKPDQIVILPRPTWITFWTAVATGAFFLGLLAKAYAVSILGLIAVLACSVAWLWKSGLKEDPGELDIGLGERAVPHPAAPMPPSLWGLVFLLGADAVMFGSLVFGYLFLWTVAANWPPPAYISPDWISPLLSAVGMGLALFAALFAGRKNRLADYGGRQTWLAVSFAASLVAVGGFLMVPAFLVPPVEEHAYASTTAFTACYVAFHALLGAIFAAYAYARGRYGWLSAARAVEMRAVAIWWSYTAATGVLALVLIHLMPRIAGT